MGADYGEPDVVQEDLVPPVRALCAAVLDDKGEVVAVLQAAWCGGQPASQADAVGVQVSAQKWMRVHYPCVYVWKVPPYAVSAQALGAVLTPKRQWSDPEPCSVWVMRLSLCCFALGWQSIALGTSIALQRLSQLAAYRTARKEANATLAAARDEVDASNRKVPPPPSAPV